MVPSGEKPTYHTWKKTKRDSWWSRQDARVRASSLWAWSVAIAVCGSASVGLGPSSYTPAAIALTDAAAAEESHGEDASPASAPTATAAIALTDAAAAAEESHGEDGSPTATAPDRAALSARGGATTCPSGGHNA